MVLFVIDGTFSNHLDYQCIGRLNGNYGRTDDFCKAYLRCANYITLTETCPSFLPYFDQNLNQCVEGALPPAGQNCVRK